MIDLANKAWQFPLSREPDTLTNGCGVDHPQGNNHGGDHNGDGGVIFVDDFLFQWKGANPFQHKQGENE